MVLFALLQIAWSNISSLRFHKFCLHQSSWTIVVTLPFEVRNEVLFIIVGFADHPVSNVPHSQPLIFIGKSYAKECKKTAMQKNLFSVICGFRIPDFGFWIPDSGFRIPVSDSRFRNPVPHSGFRFLGFRVAPQIHICHVMQRARVLRTKMNNDRVDGHCYSFDWI